MLCMLCAPVQNLKRIHDGVDVVVTNIFTRGVDARECQHPWSDRLVAVAFRHSTHAIKTNERADAPSRWRLNGGHLHLIRPLQIGAGRSIRVQNITQFHVDEAYRLNDVPCYSLKPELRTKVVVTLISGIPESLKGTFAADIAKRLGASHLRQTANRAEN
jgi:hypothetical protein